MAISQNFPTTRPSLNLNFARSKQLDPRITFTRSSVGTYVGSDGLIKTASADQPRFDHDPVTGECKGLLIEESRSNLVTNSSTYTTAINATITIDNSVTSPDGTTGVQKIQSSVNEGNLYSYTNNITNTSGSAQNYTWSVFVKKGNYDLAQVQFGGTNLAQINYLFSTDTISYSAPTATTYGRILYPNGWVRLYGTASIPNNSTFSIIVVITSVENAGGTTAYFYQWGAQIEQGSFATSYIPTSGSTATRSADNASMTGTNFSSWFNNTEGSLYSELFFRPGVEGSNFIPAIVNTDGSQYIGGYYVNDGTSHFEYYNGGNPNYIDMTTTSILPNTNYKSMLAYKNADFGAVTNGSIISTSTSSISLCNSLNTLIIGRWTNENWHINGCIKSCTYYPVRLPNTQLVNLTK